MVTLSAQSFRLKAVLRTLDIGLKGGTTNVPRHPPRTLTTGPKKPAKMMLPFSHLHEATMKYQTTFSFLLIALVAHGWSADRPNIVFIFTDDHCQQALSAYDDSRIVTPNMDRIAREGMRLDRCYCTNGICGPSRAVIQTGKYSHLNGFVRNGNRFDGSQQTFPKLLRVAGYQTAVIGKWHLASTPQGFDYYDVLKGQGPYYNPPMITADENGQPVTRPHTGYTTEIITEKTLDWLKNGRDQSKPFMVMYQHKAPHRNWQPAPKYLTWSDDRVIAEPETLWDDYEGRTQSAGRQTMTIKQHLNANDLKLDAAAKPLAGATCRLGRGLRPKE